MSRETIRLTRDVEKRGGGGDLNQGPSAYQPNTLPLGQPAHVWRWGKHCHHQNDSCIKMGSDVSHFNVSLIVKKKSQDSVHTETTFEKKGELKRIQTEVPLLTSLMPYY